MSQRSLVITWFAHEYDHFERGGGWYWAVGLMGAGAAILAFCFNNVLFGFILAFGTAITLFYGKRKPDVVHYTISVRGIQMGKQLFPFQNIKWFCVHHEDPPILVLQSTGTVFSRLSIPIVGVDPDIVRDFLLHYVKEDHHPILLAERVAKTLKL